MTGDDAKTAAPEAPESDGSPPLHIGIAAHAATWGLIFLILRVFAVSGYNWDTAFAVSTTLGVDDGLSLLFGSLMAGRLITAVLLVCVLPLLIAAYLWGPRGHRASVMLVATLGLVTLVALTVSFRSWWLPLAASVVFAVFALLHHVPRHRRLRRAATAAMARAGSVAGVAVLLGAALIQTPWVPQEQIETTDGIITGYVLSAEPGYLNVLTEEHEFVILNSSDVRSRS